jgi:hypothetical protein
MWTAIIDFWHGIVDDFERRAHVDRMRQFNDHLLEDIGLRRDQLDVLILHPQMARIERAGFGRRRQAVRPFLQGCD